MNQFTKMGQYVAEAEKLIAKAIGEAGPVGRLDHVSTYLLGHLRCTEAGLRNAQEFIKDIQSFKAGNKMPDLPSPPTQTPGKTFRRI